VTTHDAIPDAVRDAMRIVLERPIGPDEDIIRSQEHRWDSLRHVELIFSIEDACGISFDEEEMAELSSLEAIVAAVERKRAA